jgi:hypothetical protein
VIAGHPVSDACGVVEQYLARYGKTIRRYDFFEGPSRQVSPESVKATRIVASRISNEAAVWFVERGVSAPWSVVPADAELADADATVTGGLYENACALWNHFAATPLPQVSTGKISKVLHLARPALFPILDSTVRKVYRKAAKDAAREVVSTRPDLARIKRMYWMAIRQDVLANADGLETLRDELRTSESPLARECADGLSDVRLLDVCAWRIGKSGALD